jgi:3-oxoacyl-(acyl-carrier-protein) synthase
MQETQPQHRQRRIPLTTGLAVVALVLASFAVGIAVARDNTSPTHTASAPATTSATAVGFMQDACQRWMGTSPQASQVPSGWCSSMAAWMASPVNNTTMGSMMWGSDAQMRAACTACAATSHASVEWCNAMSDWMKGRASQYGGWGRWMMGLNP